MAGLSLSFVIPALNEAENIGTTLASIENYAKVLACPTEVIVVDHGSTDDTVEIAKSLGAAVLEQSGGTIAGLRNRGAETAQGNLLIFIDADVTLTSSWSQNVLPVARAIVDGERLLTGSHCAPPESDNLLLKHWFASFAKDPRNTHLGTGHMIISKRGFEQIGGFNAALRTGEDFEFCERAKSLGFQIQNLPALKVVHHDFPMRISDFVRREIWHAGGDLGTFSAMLGSKVVVGSIGFILLHAVLLIALLSAQPLIFGLAVMALAAFLLASSVVKNRHSSASTVLVNAGIFYFYYLGRSLALLRRIVSGRQQAG